MELKQELEHLYSRVNGLKEKVRTEEATKNAFIMPFIQILGYDIFNPTEVIPEFTADVGIKKGEKVDYAIVRDGKPIIIIECKYWKENLSRHNSQIHRYFNVTGTRFAILTNGIKYEIYTDLEKYNVMDEKPFLQINLEDLNDNDINELLKFHKSNFDLNNILSSANYLKYIKAIKNEFEKEIKTPSNELTKLLVNRFFEGVITSKRLESFKKYTKKAIKTFINDTVNSRLKSALTKEEEEQGVDLVDKKEISKITTTEDEKEAFQIIKAILRQKMSSDKICHRDTQSYFGVLFDNNNRKPICRLYLDPKQKRIGLFDENKQETKHDIESIDDIYDFSEQLLNSIEYYNKS